MLKFLDLKKYGKLSVGHINIVVMPDSTQNIYLQNSIAQVYKAIEKYRNQIAKEWYGKKYPLLKDSTQFYLNKRIGNRISFQYFYEPSL